MRRCQMCALLSANGMLGEVTEVEYLVTLHAIGDEI